MKSSTEPAAVGEVCATCNQAPTIALTHWNDPKPRTIRVCRDCATWILGIRRDLAIVLGMRPRRVELEALEVRS